MINIPKKNRSMDGILNKLCLSLLVIIIYACNLKPTNSMYSLKPKKIKDTKENAISKDQIIIKLNSGKLLVLNTDLKKANVKSIQYKLKDKLGIPLKAQRLIYDKKILILSRILNSYSIANLDIINFCGKLNGGMLGKVNKSDLKIVNLGNKGPYWRTVKQGLNLAVKCINPYCKQFSSTIPYSWLNKGLGTINIIDLLLKAGLSINCPACLAEIEDGNVIGFVFYKCQYKIEGYRYETKQAYFNSPNNTLEKVQIDDSTSGDTLHKYIAYESTIWKYLKINTKLKQKAFSFEFNFQ